MRLYSINDVTQLLQELLRTTSFSTTTVRKGVLDIEQVDASGTVSQTFRIRVENPPEPNL